MSETVRELMAQLNAERIEKEQASRTIREELELASKQGNDPRIKELLLLLGTNKKALKNLGQRIKKAQRNMTRIIISRKLQKRKRQENARKIRWAQKRRK